MPSLGENGVKVGLLCIARSVQIDILTLENYLTITLFCIPETKIKKKKAMFDGGKNIKI